MNNHLIQEQILELRLRNRPLAIQQQEAVRLLYWHRIVPALERLFSELVPSDRVLRIEKLELDLGSVSIKQFEEKLVQQFRDCLKELMPKIQMQSAWASKRISEGAITKFFSDKNAFGFVEPNIYSDTIDGISFSVIPVALSKLRALQFFLKTGIVRMSVAVHSKALNLVEEVLKGQAQDLVKWLQFVDNQKNGVIKKRLLTQFTTQQLMRLLEQGLPPHYRLIQRILNTIAILGKELPVFQQLFSTSFKKEVEQEMLIAALFQQPIFSTTIFNQNIGDGIKKRQEAILFENIFKKALSENVVLTKALATSLKPALPELQTQLPPPIYSIIENFIQHTQSLPDQEDHSLLDAKIVSLPSTVVPRKVATEFSTTEQAIQKPLQSFIPKEMDASLIAVMEEGIFVPNAGLVILAPFLKMWLAAIHLVKNGQFISQKHQEKAVLLTQYLVTGNTFIPEEAILLNKILCGWEIEQPVSTELQINELEQEESQQMLHAVIDYWKSLGKVSIAALQETYLLRNGKLILKNEQWKLVVERKGVDVLMENLPWSIGLVEIAVDAPAIDCRMVIVMNNE